MLFNSLEFLIFFPVVVTVYFLLPLRGRWWFLLAASCAFYMAFIPAYIFILFGTIVVDYAAGILIARSAGPLRRVFLLLSIVANVGALATFKYWNFIADNLNPILGFAGAASRVPGLSLILPIGLSFHTFQAMSYTIEVYRGRQEAERNFIVYALYVMFFPQLVAGPIERPQNMIHQLREKHAFDGARATVGLRFILWGFFKKCVVADRLAIPVNGVYGHPRDFAGPILALATVAFAIQIYADFSGYSDIAIGCAEIMGIRLMTNFRQPYFSGSVSEFWSRWHISLSTWFRDYLYIPLGGSRVSAAKCYRNLFVTFLLSGLWHGASWTYVAWGALNGLFLIVERALGAAETATERPKWYRVPLTFSLVTTAWIFFRARTISDALFILTNIGKGVGSLAHPKLLKAALVSTGVDLRSLLLTACAVILLMWVDRKASRGRVPAPMLVETLKPASRWLTYYAVVACLMAFGVFGRQQFIYFQF